MRKRRNLCTKKMLEVWAAYSYLICNYFNWNGTHTIDITTDCLIYDRASSVVKHSSIVGLYSTNQHHLTLPIHVIYRSCMIKTHHIHIHAAMLAFKCQSNVLMIRRDDWGKEGDGYLLDIFEISWELFMKQ